MEKAMKILTVSSANMDLNIRCAVAPEKGQTLFGASYRYVSGGKGANSATAFARLGAHSVFCAALGSDENGKTLRSIYEQSGIDTDYILTLDDVPTGLATVTVEDSGANRILVISGANAALTAEHAIKSAKECRPDAVFCHFEIPFDTVVKLSHYCSESGIPMFIDAGPANASLDLTRLAPVCVFSPNEKETEEFTGIAPNDEDSCRRAAKALAEKVTAKYYVLKLGSRGAAICEGDKVTIVPTYPVKAVDTTSAGDAFTAAMTLDLLRTGDIVHACKYGNAVGSVTVSRSGASESIPTLDELDEFLKANSITF